jgi:hypothetical protein
MIIYNYSKCPIRYYYSEDESLLPEFKNFKFVLDFKCSAPDFSGITRGIYDVDTDILYFQYDFEKFKTSINNIRNSNLANCVILSKNNILNEIYESLHSKIKVDGINRTFY